MKPIHYTSHPVTAISGEITVPGDKSISHRAIMLGAIANGTTIVDGFLDGDDCLATMRAFRAMGVHIEGPNAQRVVIHGVGKYGLQQPMQIIDCGNSGTSIRLLSGLLAAQPFDTQLTGDASLQTRPMNRVARPLMQMGAKLDTTNGCPPLTLYGGQTLNLEKAVESTTSDYCTESTGLLSDFSPHRMGDTISVKNQREVPWIQHISRSRYDSTAFSRLKSITYDMPQASAQVKSCLLFAGMYAQGETTVIEPEVSRDHTERMLATMGYPVKRTGNAITIDSTHACQGVTIQVPGDLSSAAFFIVAATIIPDSCLTIRNVGINPTRTGVIELLRQMGAHIQMHNQRLYGEEPIADVTIQSASLTGIDIPPHLVSLAIDEFPILLIAAACAKGKTVLRGAEELRCKESDRIGAMAGGLMRLGINATPTADGIIIQGGTLTGGTINSHHDHRIAMAFAIAGAVATEPVTIQHCNNVSTSFPDFLTTANRCGLVLSDSEA